MILSLFSFSFFSPVTTQRKLPILVHYVSCDPSLGPFRGVRRHPNKNNSEETRKEKKPRDIKYILCLECNLNQGHSSQRTHDIIFFPVIRAEGGIVIKTEMDRVDNLSLQRDLGIWDLGRGLCRISTLFG